MEEEDTRLVRSDLPVLPTEEVAVIVFPASEVLKGMAEGRSSRSPVPEEEGRPSGEAALQGILYFLVPQVLLLSYFQLSENQESAPFSDVCHRETKVQDFPF